MAKIVPGQLGPGLPRLAGTARAPARLDAGGSGAEREAILNAALGLTGGVTLREIATPKDKVALSRGRVKHIVAKPRDHRERFANRIIPTLQNPDEVWLARYNNGEYRKHYIKVWSDGKGTLAIVTETGDGPVLYNFIPGREKSVDRWRAGKLLYRRERSIYGEGE